MIHKETVNKIEKYQISNENVQAEFISFGARMTKLVFNGIDVLLGYDDATDYLSDTLFIGATVGRFAGRIGKTDISLNGKNIFLDQNENNTTCHHGGYNAFDKKYWFGEILSDRAIAFSRVSANGEGGFPGNLSISVHYTLLDNGVEIKHFATSDQDTIVNPANHAYFNLAGYAHPDAREMHLALSSDHYLPLNEKLIPTGEIRNSRETDFDFRLQRRIGIDLDNYFIFNDSCKKIRKVGSLYSPVSGIRMEIMTDQPGVQIYTCGAFQSDKGKGGIPLHLNQGIALETQGYPDNPNHPNFPTTILKAGEQYVSTTRFLFYVA